MGEMWQIYQDGRFGMWKFDSNLNQSYYSKCKFKEHLSNSCSRNGITGVFFGLENCCHSHDLRMLLHSEKINRARKNWNRFVKKNLIMLPSFVNEGDKLKMDGLFSPIVSPIEGTVTGISEDKSIMVTDEHNRVSYISPFRNFTINGEKREPKFVIKRYRKIYGADKG